MKLYSVSNLVQELFENKTFSKLTLNQLFKSISFTGVVILSLLLMLFVYQMVYYFNLFVSTKPVGLSHKALEKFVQLPSLPIIGPAYEVFQHRNSLPDFFTKWNNEFGPCLRAKFLGRNILSVHDPVLLKSMLTTNNINHLEKEKWLYKTLFVGAAKNGLVAMPAKDWVPHRKALNALFTYEAIKSYVGIYEKHAQTLVQTLIKNIDENVSSSNNIHSYTELVHLKLLDMITEITTGKSFQSVLGSSATLKFYSDLESVLNIAGNPANAFPWVCVPLLWNIHPTNKKLDKHLKDFENSLKKIIQSHVPRPDSGFPLDLMINLNWSDDEILSEVVILLVAGHETVGGAFCFLLWMLAIDQEHQIACQQEVDQIFDTLEHANQQLNVGHLSEMKYLERCIKETLRLFPSISIGISRELKSPLVLGDGIEVKAGTVLTFSPYVLHRDPKIYPNPEKFDPNRFLPEFVQKRHPYAYLPFSAGPRNCIGWKAAMVQLSVLGAVMLRHFHIRTTDSREAIKLKLSLTIAPSREPNLIFKKRNKCAKDCCRV